MKKNKTRKFFARPFATEDEVTMADPQPAVKWMPEWYKNMSGEILEENGFKLAGNQHLTVKRCLPFLDAVTGGYVFVLGYDVEVYRDKNGDTIIDSGHNILESHPSSQFPGMPLGDEYDSSLAPKWINPWMIETPKGYSTVFSHPTNRIDLPFYTIGGVVETDNYDNPVNFPFLLKKNFEGVIPGGTPIVQFHFIKREDWQMESLPFDNNFSVAKSKLVREGNPGYYKRNHREPKSYR